MIDVTRLRADTPGTDHVVHLNNAGAALMPQPVIDAMLGYLEYEVNHGGYEAHRKFHNEVSATYGSIAAILNAAPGEISLADNATRAWDMAFYGLDLGEGDTVITTMSEYVSNWAAYVQRRDRDGIRIVVVPDTPDGDIDLDALVAAIDGSTKLISMNHIPTQAGTILPAAEVGAIAREHGVPFLLDACQSVGHVPIDVEAIECDMLTATARKYLRGPRGQGFLYVREGFADELTPPFVETQNAFVFPDHIDIRSDMTRFETWEKNYAGVVGLGVAAEYARSVGIDEISARIIELAAGVRGGLDDIEGVTVRDRGTQLGGIVPFEVDGRTPIEVRELLSERNINTSVITPQSAPVDLHDRQIEGMVRASVHAYNTEAEIEAFLEAMHVIAG